MRLVKRGLLRVEPLEDRSLPSAAFVPQWNDLLVDVQRARGQENPQSARALAIRGAAVYDSVNAIDPTHTVYHVDARGSRPRSPRRPTQPRRRRPTTSLSPCKPRKRTAIASTRCSGTSWASCSPTGRVGSLRAPPCYGRHSPRATCNLDRCALRSSQPPLVSQDPLRAEPDTPTHLALADVAGADLQCVQKGGGTGDSAAVST
jgi:hypothetical protein